MTYEPKNADYLNQENETNHFEAKTCYADKKTGGLI